MLQFGVVSSVGSEASAIAFGHEPHIDNFHHLVDAGRRHHDTFARHDRYEAIHHQTVDCLMNGCPADLQLIRDRGLTEDLAWPIAAGNDA